MEPETALAARIKAIGFQCQGCSDCCRRVADESNLVMVGPPEIRQLCSATGRAWREIAEPYPEFIEDGQGMRYTFGWCLKRTADRCMFLEDDRCAVYDHRPWICRTYPFMLGEEGLVAVSARPILPSTCFTWGWDAMILSVCCNSSLALVMLMPGGVVGM